MDDRELLEMDGVIGEARPQSYLEWNDAIASTFFRPEMAGREVLLFVNDDLIERLAGPGGLPAFVAAVEQGPSWASTNLGLCQKALRALDGWRERGLEFPPYIAYLSLFVLAVGVEGPFPTHSYYPRLRTLLGWPDIDAGAPPSFDQMLRLWEDLEVWSNSDTDGELGVSSIRIAGEWIHVGLPKAQAVLTESERKALPGIFGAAGFDPTAPPPDRELKNALRRHGGSLLRPRTLDLLADRGSEPELLSVLLDTVRTELEEWDGEAPAVDAAGEYGVTAVARICLRLDEVAARVTATLRVVAKADFPEDGLTLESADRSMTLTCQEYLPGWSSPLRDQATDRDAIASALSWSESIVLADAAAGWRVRLPSSRVHIFVPGLPLELPGLVETRRLRLGAPFVLAASQGALPPLAAWAESGQVDLEEIRVREGLPSGWTLFRSAGASADSVIRNALPELALPSTITVGLRGGIRSSQGNTYFKFAPPAIVVDGISDNEDILCEGQRLEPATHSPSTFALPMNAPTEKRITVEVSRDGNVLRRQTLFLSNHFEGSLDSPLVSSDRFGMVNDWAQRGDDDVAGALGGANSATGFPIRPAIRSSQRVFIVGRRPGEIRSFPTQRPPDGWEPVWLVELGRRGQVEYCGHDLARSRPVRGASGTVDERALWKDVLWRRRKRITPPKHPRVRALWQEYVEAARV